MACYLISGVSDHRIFCMLYELLQWRVAKFRLQLFGMDCLEASHPCPTSFFTVPQNHCHLLVNVTWEKMCPWVSARILVWCIVWYILGVDFLKARFLSSRGDSGNFEGAFLQWWIKIYLSLCKFGWAVVLILPTITKMHTRCFA